MNVPTSDLTFSIPSSSCFLLLRGCDCCVTVSYEVLSTCIKHMLIETDVQLQ